MAEMSSTGTNSPMKVILKKKCEKNNVSCIIIKVYIMQTVSLDFNVNKCVFGICD
jgi:hypothetical protein